MRYIKKEHEARQLQRVINKMNAFAQQTIQMKQNIIAQSVWHNLRAKKILHKRP